MEYKDYYKVMGLTRDASQDEINHNYRKLARKYHPDVSKESDAEAKFKELGEAYEVLKNPEKRAAYNQLGANWQGGQDFNPPPNWDESFEYVLPKLIERINNLRSDSNNEIIHLKKDTPMNRFGIPSEFAQFA